MTNDDTDATTNSTNNTTGTNQSTTTANQSSPTTAATMTMVNNTTNETSPRSMTTSTMNTSPVRTPSNERLVCEVHGVKWCETTDAIAMLDVGGAESIVENPGSVCGGNVHRQWPLQKPPQTLVDDVGKEKLGLIHHQCK